MGRHSAPDDADDEADGGTAASTLALAPDPELAALIESRGRHTRGDAAGDEPAPGRSPELDETQRISIFSDSPPATEPVPDAPADPATADRRTVRESETRADLRLLRQNPAVRAQAIGAVIATLLVYTIVMIVLGRTTDYLKWLWLPIVVAGVLVGLVLDLAHRRNAKQARGADATDQGAPPPGPG